MNEGSRRETVKANASGKTVVKWIDNVSKTGGVGKAGKMGKTGKVVG